MVDGKFRRDWITPAPSPTSTQQYFGLNWPLIRYSDGVYQYIALFELSGDKVVRLTEIFGAPFPAQAFRAQFTD